jgi:hypothetical protein
MAKKRRASGARTRLQSNVTELFVETLKEFAPGSTQRLINSGIELMEAHREFLAERIARLEKIRARISSSAPQSARRAVRVRRARARRAKRAAA